MSWPCNFTACYSRVAEVTVCYKHHRSHPNTFCEKKKLSDKPWESSRSLSGKMKEFQAAFLRVSCWWREFQGDLIKGLSSFLLLGVCVCVKNSSRTCRNVAPIRSVWFHPHESEERSLFRRPASYCSGLKFFPVYTTFIVTVGEFN